MGSHAEKKNDCKNTEAAIPLVESGNPEGFQNQEGSPTIIKWSEEFRCFTVNGILAPIPLSVVPTEIVVEEEDELQLESTSLRQKHFESLSTILDTREELVASEGGSSKKRCKIDGNVQLFFKLFKFPQVDEQYLLEMHEVKTNPNVDRRHLLVYMSNGRWKLEIYDLEPGDHVVLPVLQDPSPPMFNKKYDLSLEERLIGWRVEKRKRVNGKVEKIYHHRTRKFRSFVEVATFILYSNKLKDLQIIE